MIIADASGHRVLIFGAGLIGLGVIDAMRLLIAAESSERTLDWRTATTRAEAIATIEREAIASASEGVRLSILWSAGRAGFMATSADTALELESFREVLSMSASLARRVGGVAFHLISSAGGLFEGQRHVVRDSTPAPRRPYGLLKLQQERLLLEERSFASRRIYRVSSAYGPLRPNVRAGLVSTLLLNAARGEVTQLTGHMETLRDFVFSADFGAHIADSILAPATTDDVVVLASGRPCSLFEVQTIVERVIGRKLQVAYAREAANAEDITFDASVLPARWTPSDIRWNIGILYRQAMFAGLINPAGQSTATQRAMSPSPS